MKQDNETAARDRRGVAATLAFSMLLASLGTSIVNVALPDLAQAFAAPFHDVQSVVVAYLGAMTIVVTMAGRMGDKHGQKLMLTLGLSVFLSAACFCALAPNLWSLLAGRAAQGAAGAFLMTLSTALMRRTADGARVGRAMGMLGTMSALGTALGPAIGGLVIPAIGWRGIFWIQVPLTAAALVLALAILPADERLNPASARNLRTVLDRTLAPHLLLNIVVASVMMTTLVVGPFYLGLGLGLPTSMVGAVMAIGPTVSIISGIPSGRLVDAAGSGPVAVAGLVLLVFGTVLLAFLPSGIGVGGYAFAIVVLTPGYQLFQAANNTAALANVPKHDQATVSGLLGLSRNIGLIIGASVIGGLFAESIGVENVTEAGATAVKSGMRVAFLVACAMTSIATVFALHLKTASPRD